MIHTPDSSLPPSAQSWIANHRAERLSATVSSLFNDYVHSLPWAGTTGLDWSRMPSCSSIDSSNASDAELDRWMRGTRLSRSTHAALWYSLESGGIVTPTTAVIGSLTSCSSTQQEFDSCSQWMLFAVFLTSRDFFSGGWEIESLRRRIDAPDSESHSATAVVASVACGEPGSGRALRVRSSNARRRIRSIHGRSTHRAVRLVQVFRSTAARHRLGHVDSAISQCRDDGVPLQRVTYS